ncbi:MAG: RNA degradosome polyphosphate kinase, partial [Clostridium sp.]|nr:RNA degradosome polyphosphate kinase [Clostridium sp.]
MDSYESNPQDFFNRELSFLEFNHRVLEEARDENNPLFERLKFAAIVISNLDEFYMIRYGSLSDQIHAKIYKKDASGMTPKEQTIAINHRTRILLKDLYTLINGKINDDLNQVGITFVHHENLSKKEIDYIEKLYENSIYPVLTPMVVDSSRPFPLITSET